MKPIKLFFVFILNVCLCFGQQTNWGGQKGTGEQGQGKWGSANFKLPAIGHIFGRVIDSKTNEAIPFSPVAIYKKDSVVAGGFTKMNGEFSFENIPFGRLTLKVTFIGYKDFQQTVMIIPKNEEQDVGDIKLIAEETLLKAAEVVEEKSVMEIGIDRKIFNVDKNIVSRGGTATDVMKNIPSVTLDENGNAQLRQNNATIYVDGRPTNLTLDMIPADQIDKVEVITNPSAKYQADATGGIINIVMKSNSKPGYNGIATGGVGTNDHYNAMVSLNVKEKPIGFSVVYTYHSLMNPVPGYSNRSNLYNGITTGYYNTYDHNRYQNSFQMGSASMDYYMNNHNTLSLSENYVTGTFDSYNNQTFETTDGARSVLTSGDRITNTNVRFVNYTTKLHHRKTFLKKGEELTADINYSIGSSKSPSSFTTYNYLSDGTLIADNPLLQHNDGTNQNTMLTIQSDFVNPINDSTKLELGLRSNYKPSYQALDIDTYDYSLNSYIVNQYLTSHYQIQDLVNAAYINYSMRYKKINYMLGLRFEESYYKGILTNRNDSSFHYSYPNALNNIMNAVFPSIFISKPFNDKQELQFNISRKINRPNFHQRMPFIMASDAKNYSIGNPSLTPEFITMGELNFNQTLNKGNLLFTFFARNTQSPITSYTYTSKADSSVLISTSINGKQSNTIGMDNTFKYTLFKNFETTFNMNLFYVFIDATYNSNNFSNKGFNYTTKLNMIYRLPKNFSLQLSGNYQSPKIIPQGKSSEIYFADCGLSKEIKKFITLTFSVSDIFNTKGRGTYINTDQYIQNSWGRRETRYVKFTAMIRFGKADASMFKRKKDHRQQDDQEDMGF